MADYDNDQDLIAALNRIPIAAQLLPFDSEGLPPHWRIVGMGEDRLAELKLLSFQEQQTVALTMDNVGISTTVSSTEDPAIFIFREDFFLIEKEKIDEIARRLSHSTDFTGAVEKLNRLAALADLEARAGKPPSWSLNAGLGKMQEPNARIYLDGNNYYLFHAALRNVGISADKWHKSGKSMLALPARDFYQLTDAAMEKFEQQADARRETFTHLNIIAEKIGLEADPATGRSPEWKYAYKANWVSGKATSLIFGYDAPHAQIELISETDINLLHKILKEVGIQNLPGFLPDFPVVRIDNADFAKVTPGAVGTIIKHIDFGTPVALAAITPVKSEPVAIEKTLKKRILDFLGI